MQIRRRFAAVFAALAACAGVAEARAVLSPAPADGTVEPLPSGHALVVRGPIGAEFESRFRAALKQYPQARVVIASGPGGMRGPALRVAALINERGMTVRVAGRCASACALLWASAQSREMTPASRLGLHRSRLPESVVLPAPVERHLVARNDRQTDRVLREAGFSDYLIAQGNRAPPTSMSWFTPVELQREGVPFTLLERRTAAALQLAVSPADPMRSTQQ